jgi:hypothetical protein
VLPNANHFDTETQVRPGRIRRDAQVARIREEIRVLKRESLESLLRWLELQPPNQERDARIDEVRKQLSD